MISRSLNSLNIAASTRFLFVREWPRMTFYLYSIKIRKSFAYQDHFAVTWQKVKLKWINTRSSMGVTNVGWICRWFLICFIIEKFILATTNRWIFFSIRFHLVVYYQNSLEGNSIFSQSKSIAIVQPFLVILVNYYYR